MLYTYTQTLSDQELLPHLLAKDEIVLKVPGLCWHEVERQLERLGFGESFCVAETQSSRGQRCRIVPTSIRADSSRDRSRTCQSVDG